MFWPFPRPCVAATPLARAGAVLGKLLAAEQGRHQLVLDNFDETVTAALETRRSVL